MRVSVVVPVYNGAATVERLAHEVSAELTKSVEEFEIILVHDGGADGSWPVIEKLAAESPRVRGLDLMRNYGQHNALLCGIRAARYEVIVTMDDDLQQPPAAIPDLLRALDDDVDLVYGTPAKRKHGLMRNLASSLLKASLSVLLGWRMAKIVNPFRAFRTLLRRAFASHDDSFVLLDALLVWATTRYRSVEVQYGERKHGRSSYTFGRLLSTAINTVTTFSVRPLRAATLMGFAFTLVGLGALTQTIAAYLIYGRVVPGFYFLATMIAVFSGVQLSSLGILGEYLGRVHTRTMARPAYVVRRTAGQVDPDDETDSPAP